MVGVRIDVLRKMLDEFTDQGVEVPVEMLGFGDGLRVLFPDGILHVMPGETPGVCAATGSARISSAEAVASVNLTIDPDGAAARVDVELPAPGVAAELLARCVGVEVPVLPCAALGQLSVILDDAAGATLTATGAGGTVTLRANSERVFAAEADGWRVVCIDTALSLDRLADPKFGVGGVGRRELPDPFSAELPAGMWLQLPKHPLLSHRALIALDPPRTDVPLDPSRGDGLGRPLPVPGRARQAWRGRGGRYLARAVATPDGFAVLAGSRAAVERGNGRWGLDISEDGAVASVEYDFDPIRVSGALGLLPAEAPYQAIIGGVLMFSFGGGSKGLYGTGMGAYVVPESAAEPSFFGYAGIGADPGIGIPLLRLTGVSAGLGWNSRMRLPEISELGDFPFLKALDDPGGIGAVNEDPVQILKSLTVGEDAWVTPRDDELWVAVGLGFTIAELIKGRAMAVVQTGQDLAIALLGTAKADLPKEGSRKYARIGADLRAVLKPGQGELAFDAQLTDDSFVLDPNCRLRGGVALRAWFGNSPHAGDFVYTVGGYHPNYRAPDRYPVVPRLGFDWDLTGNVTISGSAYLAITPAAAMAGGALAVRFHSGVVRAWCTAEVNALVKWKPFYVDVGLKVSIGVSASVKIVFVRITITVEVGVGLNIWGPPTGGEAQVKLWFISFTIGFGSARASTDKVLDWPGFAAMLPPATNNVRALPGSGLLVEKHPGTQRGEDYWEVSANGFTFSTDTTVPVSKLYLGDATAAAEAGAALDIRPMGRRGLTSNQRVSLTRDDEPLDLGRWTRSRRTANVASELWGTGSTGSLPSGEGHLVKDQLLGVQLTSPAARYGNSTGYMGEDALEFDPVRPDGAQPLDPDAGQVGAPPQRPEGGGVIATIGTTIAEQEARGRLAGQLEALGLRLGALDDDLSAYALHCETAFTAEPMLVSAH
ncbi:hypothetical protein OH799_06615 [Nocardia sp. NBC_00881]|uniref:DUF6603 domain-containing protein n=1 Tax=Nocardia sp. NBC_00881 TaxID=2975995 RepID=UPI0038683D26|nr:hypothetical protein OH799_06615 [Nocardia sp. NBC_00881]